MTKKNVKHLQHSVYWIKYKNVPQDILKDGYVGCCANASARLDAHKRSGKYLNNDTEFEVIATGTYDEMYALEQMLRPFPSIGWNKRSGGLRGLQAVESKEKNRESNRIAQAGEKNAMYGRGHTEETKAKMRKPKSEAHIQSMKIRSQNPNYLAKLRKPKPKEICVDCGKIMTRNIFVRYYPECTPYLQSI